MEEVKQKGMYQILVQFNQILQKIILKTFY